MCRTRLTPDTRLSIDVFYKYGPLDSDVGGTVSARIFSRCRLPQLVRADRLGPEGELHAGQHGKGRVGREILISRCLIMSLTRPKVEHCKRSPDVPGLRL